MKKSKSVLNEALSKALLEAQAELVRQIVEEKLSKMGIAVDGVLDKFVDRLLAGERSFVFDDGSLTEDVSITFNEDDLNTLKERSDLLLEKIPSLIQDAADKQASITLRAYKQGWRVYRPFEISDVESFKQRLQYRWAKGFDDLRMLLDLCLQQGEEFLEKRRKIKRNHRPILDEALIKLHARGCQVAAEIICLMENGFADGAMARWRTLYELTVVAFILAENGEELSRRYISHYMIDYYKSISEEFVRLGANASRSFRRKFAAAQRSYNALIDQYGKDYRYDHGWAANLISNNRKPSFRDLEHLAGQALTRSYYKLASQNIHAGSAGIWYQLSSNHAESVIIAGATNTGFSWPGGNTAFSIVHLTSVLHVGDWTLDDIVRTKCVIKLRDSIPPALRKIEEKIRKEELIHSNNYRARS